MCTRRRARSSRAWRSTGCARSSACGNLAWSGRFGSIVPGKAADPAAVEPASLETLPCFDVVSHPAYSAGREHVTPAWVAGEARLADRRLAGLDEQDLHDKATWWQSRIA